MTTYAEKRQQLTALKQDAQAKQDELWELERKIKTLESELMSGAGDVIPLHKIFIVSEAIVSYLKADGQRDLPAVGETVTATYIGDDGVIGLENERVSIYVPFELLGGKP